MGTSGASEAKTLDLQAAIESTVQTLLSGLSGATLVHDIGFLDCAQIGSLEMLVMNDEIIAMTRRIMRGIEVTDDALMLDLIDQVGPGGEFMSQDVTAKRCRAEIWNPTLMDRQPWDVWEAAGSKTATDRIRAKLRKILARHTPPPLPEGAAERSRRSCGKPRRAAPNDRRRVDWRQQAPVNAELTGAFRPHRARLAALTKFLVFQISRCHLRLDAQLLHQRGRVHLHPVFHDLAVRDPVDDDARHGDLLARGWDVHEPAAIGGLEGETHHHLVCFRESCLLDQRVAREGSFIARDVLLQYRVGIGDELVDHRGRLLFAVDRIQVPTYERFVFTGRHSNLPLERM